MGEGRPNTGRVYGGPSRPVGDRRPSTGRLQSGERPNTSRVRSDRPTLGQSPLEIRAREAQSHIKQLIREKDFDKARAYLSRQTYLEPDSRSEMDQEIRKAEQATIVEELTISSARRYISDNRVRLERVGLKPDFILFTLDIQELIVNDNFDEATSRIDSLLVAGKLSFNGRDENLDDLQKKQLILLMVKVLAMKAQKASGNISDAEAFVREAISQGKIVVNGREVLLEKAIKEVKKYAIELHLNVLSQGTASSVGRASSALAYLNDPANRREIDAVYESEELDEIKIKFEIQKLKELGGIEAAWQYVQNPQNKSRMERVLGKINAAQFVEELKIQMISAGKLVEPAFGTGPEAALRYIQSRREEYLNRNGQFKFGEKDVIKFVVETEIAIRSQSPEDLEAYVNLPENAQTFKELGIKPQDVLRQIRIIDRLSLLAPGDALALVRENAQFLREKGLDVDLIQFNFEVEALIQEGTSQSLDRARIKVNSDEAKTLFLSGLRQTADGGEEFYQAIIGCISAGDYDRAMVYLVSWTGRVEEKILDKVQAYLMLLKTLSDIGLAIRIPQLPSILSNFTRVPELNITDANIIYSSRPGTERRGYVGEIQRMLSSTTDERGEYYLAGVEGVDWKLGEMNDATAIAMYRFMSRSVAAQANPSQQAREVQRELERGGDTSATVIWTNSHYEELKSEFALQARTSTPVYVPLSGTRLGVEFKRIAGTSASSEFYRSGFIYSIISYIKSKNPNPVELETIARLEAWILRGEEVLESDIQWLYSKANSIDIDRELVETIFQSTRSTETVRSSNLPSVLRVGNTVYVEEVENNLLLTMAVSRSDLGQAFVSAYEIGGGDDPSFLSKDFILCVLRYLHSKDPANRAVYNRIYKNLREGKGISREDLDIFGRKLSEFSRSINQQKVREIVSSWRRTLHRVDVTSLPMVFALANGSFRTLNEETLAPSQAGAAREFSMSDFQAHQKFSYWVHSYVRDGGRLNSYSQGGFVIPNSLTYQDLATLADHETERIGSPYIHVLPANLLGYFEELITLDTTPAEVRVLLSRVISTSTKSLLLREKDRLESLPTRTDDEQKILSMIISLLSNLSSMEQRIEAIISSQGSGVASDYSESQIQFLKTLRETQKESRKQIGISVEEFSVLRRLEVREEYRSSFNLMLSSIRPDFAGGFSQEEISGIRVLSEYLRLEGKTLDIVVLTAYVAANPENVGARALLERIDMAGAGQIVEAGARFYEAAPTIVSTGLGSKPQRASLVDLKREWARETGLFDRGEALRAKIVEIQGEIRARGASMSPEELRRKYSELQSAREALDEIYQKIDGDEISRDFLVWLISKFSDQSFVSSWYGEYVNSMVYKDITTGESINLMEAIAILLSADTDLSRISSQWREMGVLFSLDPTSEGVPSGNSADRNLLIRIKQALSFLINVKASIEKVVEADPQDIDYGRELNGLKFELQNYYGVFLRQQDETLYFSYIFGQSGLGRFSKYDVDIMIKLVQGLNIPEKQQLLAELQSLKTNSDVFDSNGYVKDIDDCEDLFIRVARALSGIGNEDSLPSFVVGDPTALSYPDFEGGERGVLGTAQDMAEYLIPPLDSEYRDRVIDNFPGWDKVLEQAADLPFEVGSQFLAQQITMKYLMIKSIYWDLPAEVINEVRHGNYSSLFRLGHLALWSRLAPLWYRDFFAELQKENPDYSKALAIFWAINMLTSAGGWSGVWGRTLTLDSAFVSAMRAIPGAEASFSKFVDKCKTWSAEGNLAQRGFSRLVLNATNGGNVRALMEGTAVGRGIRTGSRVISPFFNPLGTAGRLMFGNQEAYIRSESEGRLGRWRRGAHRTLSNISNFGWNTVSVGFDFVGRGIRRGGSYVSHFVEGRRIGVSRGTVSGFELAGGSIEINPTDILAGVRVEESGRINPNGEGDPRNTERLLNMLRDAKRGNGNLHSIYSSEHGFSVEIEGERVSISEVRIVKRSGEITYELRDGKVVLYVGEEYFSRELNLANLTELSSGEPAQRPSVPVRLSGSSIGEDPVLRQENSRIVEQSLPRAQAIRQRAETPRGAGEPYATTGDDLFVDIVREHRELTRGQTLRHVQLQTLSLASEGVDGHGNVLFQIGTGEGKSWLDLYTGLSESLKPENAGKVIYIVTTDDSLVSQLEDDYSKVRQIFERRGVSVGFRRENSQNPESIYQNHRIVVVSVSDLAFDTTFHRTTGRPSIMIADEIDFYAIETAATRYITTDIKGRTGNPVIDFLRRGWSGRFATGYRGKWSRAYQTYDELMLENQRRVARIRQGETGVAPLIDPTGSLTQEGQDFMRTRLGSFDSFISMQFKAFYRAHILLDEKFGEIPPNLSLSEKFTIKYRNVRTGAIISLEQIPESERPTDPRGNRLYRPHSIVPLEPSGNEAPNKVLGRGVNEALCSFLGIEIQAEHVTLADIDIRQLFRAQSRIIGFSGSIGESHELISNAYPDLGFKVVEMPSFIPKVEITLEDLRDPAKLEEKLQLLRERVIAANQLNDSDPKLPRVRAKVVLRGGSPEEVARMQARWGQIIASDTSLSGVQVSTVELNRYYVPDPSERIRLAVDEAVERAQSGNKQPVLITLETPEEYARFKTELQRRGITPNELVGTGAAFETAKARASGEGVITLTYYARGLDITVAEIFERSRTTSGTDPFVRGGLHVISVGSSNKAKTIQQLGRGGRSAFPGSGSIYISGGDYIFRFSPEPVSTRESAGTRIDLYDPANAEISTRVDDAFRASYQANYEAMVRTFEESGAREELLSVATDLSSRVADRRGFARALVEHTLDYLFMDLGIEDGTPMSREARVGLEAKLTRLLGGVRIKIGIADGAVVNTEALRRGLSEKIISELFSNLRQGDVNVDRMVVFPDGTRKPILEIMLADLLGETNARISSQLEDMSHETEMVDKEAELRRISQRESARMLSKAMHMLFGNRFNPYSFFRRGTHTFTPIELTMTEYSSALTRAEASPAQVVVDPTAPVDRPEPEVRPEAVVEDPGQVQQRASSERFNLNAYEIAALESYGAVLKTINGEEYLYIDKGDLRIVYRLGEGVEIVEEGGETKIKIGTEMVTLEEFKERVKHNEVRADRISQGTEIGGVEIRQIIFKKNQTTGRYELVMQTVQLNAGIPVDQIIRRIFRMQPELDINPDVSIVESGESREASRVIRQTSTHIKQPIRNEIEQIRSIDADFANALETYIKSLPQERADAIDLRKLRELRRIVLSIKKGATFGQDKHSKVGQILESFGISVEQKTNLVSRLRSLRIASKWGRRVLGIVGERISAQRLGEMSFEDFAKLMGKDIVKINPASIKTPADMLRIAEAVRDPNTILVYESAEKISVKGSRADFMAWIQNGDQSAFERILRETSRANRGVPQEFIAGFLQGNKSFIRGISEGSSSRAVAVSIPVYEMVGTKEQIIQRLTTFEYTVSLDGSTEVSFRIKNQDAIDLMSSDAEVSRQAKLRIIQDIKTQDPNARSVDIFRGIETYLKAVKTNMELSSFIEREMARVRSSLYSSEMARMRAQFDSADAEGKARIISEVEGKVAETVEIYRTIFQEKANLYIENARRGDPSRVELSREEMGRIFDETKREFLTSRGRYAELLRSGHLGGGALGRAGSIGVRTVRDGLMGLGVEAVLGGISEVFSDDPSFMRYLEKVGTSGLHWAKFGAMAGASEYLIGLSETASMATAMFLPALWDLSSAPAEMKGRVLFGHAMGAFGFLAPLSVYNRVAAPAVARAFPKLGGLLGLGIGIAGATLFGYANEFAYERSEAYRSVVDSRTSRGIGTALGDSSTLLTTSWGFSIGSGLFNAASFGATLLGAGSRTVSLLSRTATVLGTTGNVLLVLGVVKGGFSLWYELENGDYEKTIAERLGRDIWNRYCDDTQPFCMSVRLIGGSFKYDQQVEDFTGDGYAELNPEEREFLHRRIIDVIGGDFEQSLSMGDAIAGIYGGESLTNLGNFSGDYMHDYRAAYAFIRENAQLLTQRMELNPVEITLYQAVMNVIKEQNLSGFEDQRLLDFLTTSPFPGLSNEAARAILVKFKVVYMQNMVKQILLVDPSEEGMGENLYGMVNFWNEEERSPHFSPSANPFRGTPVMKMAEVRTLHTVFSGLFNSDGTLRGDKVDAFADWVLTREVKGKSVLGIIREGNTTVKSQRIVSDYFTISRMFELIRSEEASSGESQLFGNVPYNEQDEASGLIVQTPSGHWTINRESKYYIAYREANCLPDENNVSKVLARIITQEDIDSGFVDSNGYINLENPEIREVFAEVEKGITFHGLRNIGDMKISLTRAEREASDAMKRYVSLQQQLLRLMAEDNPDERRIARLNREFEAAARASDAKMETFYRLRNEYLSYKITVMKLQKEWFETRDPIRKRLLHLQLRGMGAYINNVDTQHVARITDLMRRFEATDPNTHQAEYQRVLKDIEDFNL